MEIESKSKGLKILHVILTIITDCVICFVMASWFAIFWARKNYPMQLHSTVLFVLKSSTAEGDSNLFSSMWRGFIAPGLISFLIYRAVTFIIIFNQKKWWGKEYLTYASHYLFALVYTLVIGIIAAVTFRAWKYPIIMHGLNKKPVESKVYDEHYKVPVSTVAKGEKKRNLVIIFMESAESTYFDVEHGGVFKETPIPRLQELAKNNINFSGTDNLGGGVNIEGTSWTAAGMLSKLSGLPYYNPFIKTADGIKCLRGAKFLSDILSEDGYKCIFSMGSDKRFEDRAPLFESHSTTIHDIEFYKKDGFIPSDYKVFWGFEDEKLYRAARKELFDLGERSLKGEPFFFGMLTVDTHFPSGFLCEHCEKVKKEGEPQIFTVLRCADDLAANLVEWIGEQPWGEDTTVVILGDHCYLDAPDNNFIADNSVLGEKETKLSRRFLNIVINPSKRVYNNELMIRGFTSPRLFTSLDMMPTILVALGRELEDEQAGLGVSLFWEKKTLLEELGKERLEKSLMMRTKEYDALR